MKNLFFNIIKFSGVLLLFIYACNTINSTNIKKYYFPLEQLDAGKIYEYRFKNKENNISSYKHYKVIHIDDGTFLLNNNYNPLFFNDHSSKNKVIKDGVILKDYHMNAIILEQEDVQTSNATIIKNNTFSFNVTKESPISMEMIISDPTDKNERIRFSRDRYYAGDTIYTYKGEDIPAIIIHTNEMREFTHIDEGDFDNTIYGTEVYAQNLGLVIKTYKINESLTEIYLHDTYDFSTLTQKAQEFWGQDVIIEPIQ